MFEDWQVGDLLKCLTEGKTDASVVNAAGVDLSPDQHESFGIGN